LQIFLLVQEGANSELARFVNNLILAVLVLFLVELLSGGVLITFVLTNHFWCFGCQTQRTSGYWL